MDKERRNAEHYQDDTAYSALYNIECEERAKRLISVLLYIIHHSGFELEDRIHLVDEKTGRKFR